MRETLSFHIAALYRDFLAYTTGELKKLGLSFGQMPLILYAGKHPNCTQADLTKALRLDWGYSQRSIAKLTESGFMRKEYDRNRSGNCLTLTETGARAFAACHQVFGTWDCIRTSALSDEEKKTLILLLNKMTGEGKQIHNDQV